MCKLSHLYIHEYLCKPEKLERISGKGGIHTQLLIALECKTGTKLMRRQSSSILVKYGNYLIAIYINIDENYRN